MLGALKAKVCHREMVAIYSLFIFYEKVKDEAFSSWPVNQHWLAESSLYSVSAYKEQILIGWRRSGVLDLYACKQICTCNTLMSKSIWKLAKQPQLSLG